jgi:uncharacterized membrane protein YccC
MRRLVSGLAPLAVLATVALAAVLFFLPGRRHLAVDVYVLVVGALGLAAAVRATRAAWPDVHEPSLAAELDDPLDVLRPLLREIAAHRLLRRHGVDLDRRPDAAEKLVGAEAWAWLRPDREEPRDRWAPGPPLAELRGVVDALERI